MAASTNAADAAGEVCYRSVKMDAMQPDEEVNLQMALEKLVRFGQQVGIGPDEMIRLLESGITLSELLRYVASKSGVA